MSCAIYIAIPTRPLGLPEALEVYNIAIVIEKGYYAYAPNHLSF